MDVERELCCMLIKHWRVGQASALDMSGRCWDICKLAEGCHNVKRRTSD